MNLGFVGAGFIARFQSVAIEQVRGLEIARMAGRRGSKALAAFCRNQQLPQPAAAVAAETSLCCKRLNGTAEDRRGSFHARARRPTKA